MADPATLSLIARLAPIALSAGKHFLDRGAVNKAQRRNKQALATSNFINALSPRAQHVPTLQQPRESGVSRLLGAANTGFNVFNTIQDARRANELFDLQKQAAEGQLGDAQFTRDLASGQLAAQALGPAAGQTLRSSLGAPRGPSGRSAATGALRMEGPVAPSNLSETGQQSFLATLGGLNRTQAAQQAASRQAQEQQRLAAEEAQRKAALEEGKFQLDVAEFRRKLLKDTTVPDKESPLTPTQRANIESTLRKDFIGLSRDFRQVRDAFGRIQTTAKNVSAAGDLSLIFNYMKMLDPGSTVREGEFATAQNAGGVSERLVGLYNRVVNGQRLADPQRTDFLQQARNLWERSQVDFLPIKTSMEAIATRSGVDPQNVVLDFGTPTTGSVQNNVSLLTDNQLRQRLLANPLDEEAEAEARSRGLL